VSRTNSQYGRCRLSVSRLRSYEGLRFLSSRAGQRSYHPSSVCYQTRLETADVDNYNKRAKEIRENSFIMPGTLGALRWWLNDIKGGG
jgi:hypothetical protein